MWPFKRKKRSWQSRRSDLPCSFCGSNNTEIKARYNSDQPDYIRIWRGRRYITCRCLECGRDFYIEETLERAARGLTSEERLVDDEEELRAAEEKLKKQLDDQGDRRYR